MRTKKNPIYKLIFMHHANAIERCDILQCLGLISDEKAEERNKKHCMLALKAAYFGGFGGKEINDLFNRKES